MSVLKSICLRSLIFMVNRIQKWSQTSGLCHYFREKNIKNKFLPHVVNPGKNISFAKCDYGIYKKIFLNILHLIQLWERIRLRIHDFISKNAISAHLGSIFLPNYEKCEYCESLKIQFSIICF